MVQAERRLRRAVQDFSHAGHLPQDGLRGGHIARVADVDVGDLVVHDGEGPARVFAAQGIAGVSSALVKNPERYGRFKTGTRWAELPFYNFFRGDVMVANHWQAAADNAVLLRLMRGLTIDPKLCPQTDASAAADGQIRFNPSFFFGMGFSMGGTILGNWAGVEPGIIASIPAGPSGHWGLLIRNFTWGENLPWFYAWLTGGKK